MFVEPGARPSGSPDPDRENDLGQPHSSVYGPNRYGVETQLTVRRSAPGISPQRTIFELDQHYFDRESGRVEIVLAQGADSQSILAVRIDSAKQVGFFRAFSPRLQQYDCSLAQLAFSIVQHFQDHSVEETLAHIRGVKELRAEEYSSVKPIFEDNDSSFAIKFSEIVARWEKLDQIELRVENQLSDGAQLSFNSRDPDRGDIAVMDPDQAPRSWDAAAFRRIAGLSDDQKQHEGICVSARVVRSHKFENGSALTLMRSEHETTLVISISSGEQEMRVVCNAPRSWFWGAISGHKLNKAFDLLATEGLNGVSRAASLCRWVPSDSITVYCSGAVHDISEECADTLADGGAKPQAIGVPLEETIRDILLGREVIHLSFETNNYSYFSSVLIRLAKDGAGVIKLKNKLGAELEVQLDPSENTPYRSYELRQIMSDLTSEPRRAVQHLISAFRCIAKGVPLHGKNACEGYERAGEICAAHSQFVDFTLPDGTKRSKRNIFYRVEDRGQGLYQVTLRNIYGINLEFGLEGAQVKTATLSFDRWWGEQTRFSFSLSGDRSTRDQSVWQLIRLLNSSDSSHSIFRSIKNSKIFAELTLRAKSVEDPMSRSRRSMD